MAWDDIKVGDVGTTMKYGPLNREEFVVYAGTGGDSNPIHQDEFAGIFNKGIIAHGLYSHALLGEMLDRWVGTSNVRKYGGRMLGMTRPGDTIEFKAVITKKYEEGGEKLVDFDLTSTTRTVYVMGKAESELSEEEILKNLEGAPLKVNIEFTAAGDKKFEMVFEPKGIQVVRKNMMANEALVREWIRADKDKVIAEFLGKKKGSKFKFALVRYRDSIVGTGTVALS